MASYDDLDQLIVELKIGSAQKPLLDAIAKGEAPDVALKRLLAADSNAASRQVGVIDLKGRSAQHTGTRPNDDETQMWLRHDYFYEKAPSFWKGIVGWYVVRVNNPDQAMAFLDDLGRAGL